MAFFYGVNIFFMVIWVQCLMAFFFGPGPMSNGSMSRFAHVHSWVGLDYSQYRPKKVARVGRLCGVNLNHNLSKNQIVLFGKNKLKGFKKKNLTKGLDLFNFTPLNPVLTTLLFANWIQFTGKISVIVWYRWCNWICGWNCLNHA